MMARIALAVMLLAGAARADDRGVKLSRAEAKADIAYALERAEAIHPNLYWFGTRAAALARTRALVDRLPDPATSMDVYLALREVIGLLGDGHVFVYRPAQLVDRSRLFDAVVAPTGDGLRVLSRRHTPGVAAGDLIRTINGQNAERLFARGMDFEPGEPGFKLAEAPENFGYLLWEQHVLAPFRIKGVSSNRPWSVTVDRQDDGDRDEAPPADQGLRTRTLPDGIDVIELLRMTAPRAPFRKRLFDIFADLDARRSKALIVDLRQDGGGNSGLGDDLVGYFSDKPRRAFARKTFKASSECRAYFAERYPGEAMTDVAAALRDGETRTWDIDVKAPIPEVLRFAGPVAVLIGPDTFSSGNILANMIGDFHLATLVGQDTAEITNNFGEPCPIILPHTRIRLTVPSTYFARANGDEASREDVHPDVAVPHPAALPLGADPDLDAARAWIAARLGDGAARDASGSR